MWERTFLRDLAVVLAASFPVLWVCRRLKLPQIVGFLVTGVAIGPHALGWVPETGVEAVAGFGVALRMKGETADELSGLAQTMLDRATPISVPGPLVDLVGTGGDAARTVNISTMGAIVAAAAGALVSVPATFTNLLVGIDENALPALWHRMRTGAFVDTTWSLGFGRLGIVLYALTIGAGGCIIATRTGVRRGARFRLA